MGAERKGPLAAFIVVAIIAVILLVTSVRSQAAPGWLDRRLPSSVVAVVPSPDSGLWGAVGNGMERIAAHGVVLVHRTPTGQGTDDGVVTASVSERAARPTRHAGSSPRPAAVVPEPARGTAPGADRRGPTRATRRSPTALPAPAPRGTHGRHLGWGVGHGHGHGRSLAPPRPCPRTRRTPGHGHGHGRHLGWARQGPAAGSEPAQTSAASVADTDSSPASSTR